jgi:hypothetical protein
MGKGGGKCKEIRQTFQTAGPNSRPYGQGDKAIYFFVEAYPSAYQPPPFNSNEHGDMIFLAILWHLGHSSFRVSIRTRFSNT